MVIILFLLVVALVAGFAVWRSGSSRRNSADPTLARPDLHSRIGDGDSKTAGYGNH